LNGWTRIALALAISLSIGPWVTSRDTGSSDASMRLRAIVALRGLLALTSREAVYFNATVDDEGRALDGGCHYVIVGPAPSARWWSLTVYDLDGYLFPNPDHAYSIGGSSTEEITVRAGPEPIGSRWIATQPGEPFELTLRTYGPEPDLLSGQMPQIERLAC
jgi:hypothetical protein